MGFALLAFFQLAVGLYFLAKPAARRSVFDPAWVLGFIVACLLLTIASQRVFSPQYVVWLIPAATVLPVLREKIDWMAIALFSGIVVLTFIEFDYEYEGLLRFDPVSTVLLAARNTFVVLAAAMFAMRTFAFSKA